MIEYRTSMEGITPEMLDGFFVGWPKSPSPATLLQILDGSSCGSIAVDPEKNIVVGFAYAISDGVLSAYIPLLEVLPEYQGQGIGQKLISLITESLASHYMIDIVCDPELESFYSRLGFQSAFAMIQRNYANQDGGST